MTFTYSAYRLEEPLYRMRLELGDTDEDNYFLEDEEIEVILSEESDFNLQAAKCCRLICTKLARLPDRYRLGQFEETWKDTYTRFLNMATLYGQKSGRPWAGGISVDSKRSYTETLDRVKPAFRKGMHDNE